MDNDTFQISTSVFEGPLDLLLQLIEKHKLFISDISLASVTDDFIEHIKSVGDFPMSQSAHFILIASTLLLLKSKSLLPSLTLTQEEEESIEDLEKRLKLYKYFQGVGKSVSEGFGKNILFPKIHTKMLDVVFSPQKDYTKNEAYESALSVIDKLPRKKQHEKVEVKNVISLEETLTSLTERVQKNLTLSFKEFSKAGKTEKVNVIVSFLAMLELVKQEMIHVKQDKHFDDIHMESKSMDTPNY